MITVMISSTSRDLPDHRIAANAACMGLNTHPVMMENLPALDTDAIDASLKMVADADVYIGILAQRYGYVPASPKNPERISITEMEYRHAVELNKPRLIFVAAADHDPPFVITEDAGAQAKLVVFRECVLRERVVQFFKSPDELRAHVTQALAHWLDLRLEWMPAPLPDRATPLPTDPIGPPPGSRILIGRNTYFVGRGDTLRDLEENLLFIETNTVITGAGGLGKSQLAVEFTYRCGRYFWGAHWIDLHGQGMNGLDSRLDAEIAANGRAMNLSNFPNAQPEQVVRTLNAWAKSSPRLIILDNAESTEVVQHVLARLRGLHILITTQWDVADDWRDIGCVPCALDVLTREQSLDLLRQIAPHLASVSNAEIDPLAERLGDYPLALDLAARYLRDMLRAGLTVAEFLIKLDTTGSALDHTALRDWATKRGHTSPTRHDTDLFTTFNLSWNRVNDPLARDLFRACGYLAPNQPIPDTLLRRLTNDNLEEMVLALAELTTTGLLRTNAADRLEIHSLLADFARQQDVEATQLARVVDALGWESKMAIDTGLPAKFAPLRLHVETVAKYAAATRNSDAGGLFSNLGYHLDDLADFTGAQTAYEQAIHTLEIQLGKNHPAVASALSNLGETLRKQGQYSQARSVLERALYIDETEYGPDDPAVARDVNNLGSVLQDMGDLTEAQLAYERALRIDEAIYGPNDIKVATDINNLGEVLRLRGRYSESRAAFEKALSILEKELGENHPSIATAVNNYASVLQDLGDWRGAQAALERALQIDEATFHPDHPDVAVRLNNLGLVLFVQRDFVGAQAMFERALRINEAALGAYHPTVAIVVNNLGELLKTQEDYAGAQTMFERALQIDETALGNSHYQVATDINNLGEVLEAQGDYAGAQTLFERALSIGEAALGQDHPNVAVYVNNLGKTLYAQGDYEGARAMFERAVSIDETVFGPSHPNVALHTNNLARVLYALKDFTRARAAYERALPILEQHLGQNHQNVATTVNNLGLTLRAQGDHEGARAAFERALRIKTQIFPPDHPSIQITRRNLAALNTTKAADNTSDE